MAYVPVKDPSGEAERVLAALNPSKTRADSRFGEDDIMTLLARVTEALQDDMELALPSGGGEDVSAADLNAAAAGTLKRGFDVVLQNASGFVHSWASSLTLDAVAGKTVTDGDIGDVVATVLDLVEGVAEVVATFDTDAGSTKVYQDGDVLTLTFDFSGYENLPSLNTLSTVVMTYDVIA